MLRKLLKYDIKAIWKIWVWLAVAAVLISVMGGLCMRFLVDTAEEASAFIILKIIAIFGVLACYLTIAALLFVTAILVYWRFYKNFFSDEGYLTFTLPVSRAQLLLSKTLNAAIWMVASGAVITLCFAEVILIVDPVIFADLFQGIGWLLRQDGAWVLLMYLPQLLLLGIASLWFNISLIQLCITIGSVIAKKHKILASIGVYYLVNMVLGFAGQLITIVGVFTAVGSIESVLSKISSFEAPFFLGLVLLVATVIVASAAYLLHIITLDKLERRLNLA
ncbi:MAG: hypothetical protein IJW29_07845 [Clostridia bacterium]|nr:hypothetical protein [Clostridia bacterium]